ncbi:MAG: hypothetical protein E6K80_09555 [Candidatus Eisenbacteria bacterium]|uniref:Uncharacterized protein n=1 Tax=Eiseniibacteriota bacterium TaxID=2212470 RepID=A0A538U2R1_UNCEI|nr:MAG: hypothetical protein E6K80_09555 [Candidatus Eisenbacteria bacterium]
MSERDPSAAERFLQSIRDRNGVEARRLLAQDPGLAHADPIVACCVGEVAVVAKALERDFRLATAPHEASRWPPLLHVSASSFHAGEPERARAIVRCAELLLEAGADPDAHTLSDPDDPESRLPALYFACVGDHPGLVELLLAHGADPNDGESVYHAAELDRRDCLELLRAHGADLSRCHPRWNNTPLYFLAGYRELNPGMPAALEGMRWLLEHGADPDVPSYQTQETPLHMVARNGGPPAMAALLLEHGAAPEARRADGRTPYALALRSGNAPVLGLLEARGAASRDVAATDRLLAACMLGDAAAARAELTAHPDLLEQLSAEERALPAQAAHEGRIATVRLMARLGFDLGAEAAGGGTPLHHAAWAGNPEMVRLLLELGAPVNVRDRQYGSSPLGWGAHGSRHCRAADRDYAAVMEALLDAGADRETSINRWGEPPESFATPRVAAVLKVRGFAA